MLPTVPRQGVACFHRDSLCLCAFGGVARSVVVVRGDGVAVVREDGVREDGVRGDGVSPRGVARYGCLFGGDSS